MDLNKDSFAVCTFLVTSMVIVKHLATGGGKVSLSIQRGLR